MACGGVRQKQPWAERKGNNKILIKEGRRARADAHGTSGTATPGESSPRKACVWKAI